MVLALQGLGSCPLLSPNLVCIPPPPAAVKADGVADTALKRLGSAEQCLDTAFSSDRGGAERVKHSGGGLQRNEGGVGCQPERSEV